MAAVRQCLSVLLFVIGTSLLAAPPTESGWLQDYQAARRAAKEQGRPLVLDFGTANCFWCKKLDASTLRELAIVKLLSERFVAVKIDAEREAALTQALGITSFPTLVFADPEGKILGKHVGFVDAAKFQQQLERALRESAPTATVARGAPVDQEREARQILLLAQADQRADRPLACLDRCRHLAATYPQTAAAAEARQLAAALTSDPDKLRSIQSALADLLGEMYLASAETAVRQGQVQTAVAFLERIQHACPDSRHATSAQERLTQIRPQRPIVRAQGP